jgi:hypothetical protein
MLIRLALDRSQGALVAASSRCAEALAVGVITMPGYIDYFLR